MDKTKPRSKHATIKITQLVQRLKNLRRSAYMSSTRRLSFDDLDNYTNADLLNLPGLAKQQFEKLVEMVSTLKKSRLCHPDSLLVYYSVSSYFKRGNCLRAHNVLCYPNIQPFSFRFRNIHNGWNLQIHVDTKKVEIMHFSVDVSACTNTGLQ